MNTLNAILLLLSLCAAAENDQSRISLTGMGQELADIFIGAAWKRVSEAEFVGGLADVYINKQNIFPEVETSYGRLKGFTSLTCRDGTPYSAFMGIPFAAPPVGVRRFKAPEPPQPWEGIRDATYERPTCLTFREPTKGNEDCLYLNVFTPTTNPEKSENGKPVLVFIYGGAFMGGSSNTSGYAPDFLLDKDVLLVTFNYRIGPLGFLSLQNKEVPGNAGLKDQIMALRWVKRNIENFGGNPSKITIFGESAGAASVSYLVLSPLAKGLFDRAIMESGSALAGWAYTNPKVALQKAFLLGQRIGCTSPSSLNQAHELYQCFLDTPGPLLTRAQSTGLSIDELLNLRPLAFVPTAEPDHPGAALTKDPASYFTNGDFNHVPTIMGINTAEGLLFYPAVRKLGLMAPDMLVTFLGGDMTKLMPNDLYNATPQPLKSDLNQRIHKFYTGNPQGKVTTLQFLQVISDTQFLIPMLQTADMMASKSDEPVFIYNFSYDGPYTCYKLDDDMKALNGTCHMDELGYLFNLGPIKKSYNHSNRNTPAEKVIDLMTKFWRHFADSGYPSQEKELWKPFCSKETNYCDIGVEPIGRKSLQRETVHFWNDLYEKIFKKRLMPE